MPPPNWTLSPAVLPAGVAGAAYSVQLAVGPVVPVPAAVFGCEVLPPGLVLGEGGLLSGVPVAAGSWVLVIGVVSGEFERVFERPLSVFPGWPGVGVRGMSPVRRAGLGGRP